MWLLAALSGAFFKALSGYNRKKVSHLSSGVFTFIYCVISAVLLLPFVILFHSPVLDFILREPVIAIGAAIGSQAGMLMNVKALSKEELSFVAPLNGMIPVIGVLLAW